MNIHNFLRIALFAGLLSTVGCATQHQVVDSVRSDGDAGIESVALFVALPDPQERQMVEDSLSEELSAQGLETAVSYIDMPELEQREDLDAVQQTRRNTGANMALTVDMVAPRNEAARQAGAVSNAVWLAALVLDAPEIRQAAAYGSLAAYSVGGKYEMLVRLWDMETGRELWRMTTRSFSNDRGDRDIALLAESIASELRAQQLLPGEQQAQHQQLAGL